MQDETSQDEFYGAVRENTVALLSALALQGAASAILRRYRFRRRNRSPLGGRVDKPPPNSNGGNIESLAQANGCLDTCETDTHLRDDVDYEEDELSDASIGVLFCSAGLAAALGELLLLPLTAALESFVERSMLERFWNYATIASAISLYGLMPFCYFFLEANGVTSFAKIKECFQIVGLFWTLGVGLVYITIRMLGAEAFIESHPWLSALIAFTSFPCGLACGLATPRGVVSLFRYTASWVLPLDHRNRIIGAITEREFEIMALDNRLHGLTDAARRPSASRPLSPKDNEMGIQEIQATVKRLQSEIANLRKKERANPFTRLTIVGALLSIELAGWISVMVRLTSSLAETLFGDAWWLLRIEKPSPVWWKASEIMAVAYFGLTTIVGFYNLTPSLMLKVHRTPARHVISSIIMLLALSIALPLVSRCLGLVPFGHGPYAEMLFLRHPWAIFSYKMIMMWLFATTGRS